MSDRFEELISKGCRLKHGPEQVAVYEEAVREADSLNDLDRGFEARRLLVEAGTFGGASDKALVAFTWNLARYDEEPDRFYDYNLMWSFKWIIGSITNYPTISRQQIEQLMQDMERRYDAQGYSMRAVYDARWCNAISMGDHELAKEYYDQWKNTERDWMTDCSACERNSQVWMNARLNRHKRALQMAKPIFEKGMSCEVIPAATHAEVLRPLLSVGRLEEAAQHHEKGYRMVRNNPDFLSEAADHLCYLGCIGSYTKGLRMLERHWPWVLGTADVDNQFDFLSGAIPLLDSLAKEKKTTRKIRLPSSLSCYREDSTYDIPELSNWLSAEAREMADRFNERNGNDYYTRRIEDNLKLAHKVRKKL